MWYVGYSDEPKGEDINEAKKILLKICYQKIMLSIF